MLTSILPHNRRHKNPQNGDPRRPKIEIRAPGPGTNAPADTIPVIPSFHPMLISTTLSSSPLIISAFYYHLYLYSASKTSEAPPRAPLTRFFSLPYYFPK